MDILYEDVSARGSHWVTITHVVNSTVGNFPAFHKYWRPAIGVVFYLYYNIHLPESEQDLPFCDTHSRTQRRSLHIITYNVTVASLVALSGCV